MKQGFMNSKKFLLSTIIFLSEGGIGLCCFSPVEIRAFTLLVSSILTPMIPIIWGQGIQIISLRFKISLKSYCCA